MPFTNYVQDKNLWRSWIDYGTSTYRMSNTTNTYIWNQWNVDQTGSIYVNTVDNTLNVYNNNVWNRWANTYTTTAHYIQTNNTVWDGWIQPAYVAQPIYRPAWREERGAPALVRSEEEWTVIREEQERQRKLRDELQREAREEARKLMRVVLTAEQVAMYEERGYFEVRGSEGGLFRIYHGTSGNLKQVVDGVEVNALCVHPRLKDHRSEEGEGTGYLPTEDSMIAQAFALMHDELAVVQTANVHRGPRHLRAVPDLAVA